MLDLNYLLLGITEGTVSITNMKPNQPNTIYNDTKPCDVKLDGEYEVTSVQRNNINGRYDYHICVVEK